MADETKPESVAPSGGEPAKPETPAPDAGVREASKEPDYKRMYLDGKGKIEEANRILREQQERKPDPAPAGQGEPKLTTADFAAAHDPVAADVLLLRQEQRLFDELSRMRRDGLSDADEERLLEVFRNNRDLYGTLKAAHDATFMPERAKTLAEENEELKKRLALAEVNANMRNDPNMIRTAEREVTASRLKGTIKQADLDRDQEHLPRTEALKQQAALYAGRLTIED